jgi:hypothetical protein
MFVSQRCVITLLSGGTLIEFNKTFTLPSLSLLNTRRGPPKLLALSFASAGSYWPGGREAAALPLVEPLRSQKCGGGGGKLCGETIMKFEGEEGEGGREEGVCPIM